MPNMFSNGVAVDTLLLQLGKVIADARYQQQCQSRAQATRGVLAAAKQLEATLDIILMSPEAPACDI